MAISYPLSMPADRGAASISIRAKSVVGVSENPFTLAHQVQQWDGQRWEAEVTLPPMIREDAEAWIAFLIKLNGRYGTFLMGDPAGYNPRGTAGGSPLINGSSQTGNSLITDGWSAGATFLAGDYFQLGSGSNARLFKNLTDQTADGSGNMTIDIWPSIRTAFADGSSLTVTNARGLFRLASNEMPFDVTVPGIYGITFSAMSEAVT